MVATTQLDNLAGICGSKTMSWRKPVVTRISVGCEINAYGCAVV
jgi:coenzyme PQQ precursor peptide PqqA